MAHEFVMPKLGDIMEEGKVVAWKKQVGESIQEGEVLLEIETDKATVEVESDASGTIQTILVHEDQTVPVGTPLAVIE